MGQTGLRPQEVNVISQDRNITFDILEKVSEKEGCDALDLPPLHDSIDPDALNSLAMQCKIQFEYVGYNIIVENGTITVGQ